MTKFLAALALVASATAAAANVTQLERQLGVEPGQFTRAELVRMLLNGGDDEDVNRRPTRIVPGRPNPAAEAQLAMQLGVEPGRFTLAELHRIKVFRDDETNQTRREDRLFDRQTTPLTAAQRALIADLRRSDDLQDQ